MKNFIYVFFSIFLVSCVPSKNVKTAKNEQRFSYPSWFLEPNQNIELLVGYSENFWIETSSVEFAVRNALQNYSHFKGVKISGERLTAASSFQKGSQAFHEETVLNNFKNLKIVPISSFKFGENYFLLSGFEISTNFDETLQNLSKEIPSEFENLKDSETIKFAVGIASLENYSREFYAWLEAERDARIRLAEKIDSKISNLTKTFNGISESFTSTKVEGVTLKNVQILMRWKDVKLKLCYVLVKIEK